MDLRQLQYFLKVIECGSITVAAERLGLAQPTLTKSLHQLEKQLGVALLRRLPRGVEPTEAGLRFARHGQAVDVQLRDAVREIRSFGSLAGGELAIGAGPAWLRRLLPEAVTRVVAAHPELSLKIVGGFDDSLLRDLRAGALDLVIAELPVPEENPDLVQTTLVSDALGVVVREGHPLAGRRRAIRELAKADWVMPPSSTRAQQRLNALFVAAGQTPPRVRIETGSMALLLSAVRCSDFLTYTVATTLDGAEGNGLTMLEVPQLNAKREAGILLRKGGWISPAMEAVIEEMRLTCARAPRN